MTSGTVRDIRTGRALHKTRDLSETFISYVQALTAAEEQFYVVFGRCRHEDVRETVDGLRSLSTFPVIFDRQMPSDTIWIFQGLPEELGFAS